MQFTEPNQGPPAQNTSAQDPLIGSSFSPDLRFVQALQDVIDLFKADSGTIHVLESDGLLHLKAAKLNLPPHIFDLIKAIPPGKGIAGLAFSSNAPVSECNIQTNQSGVARPGAKATGLKGSLAVPIPGPNGPIGVLGIGYYAEHHFTEAETRLLIESARALGQSAIFQKSS